MTNVRDDSALEFSLKTCTEEWIVGLPLWIRVEIRNKSEHTLVGPYWAPLHFRGVAYRLELRLANGAVKYRVTVPPLPSGVDDPFQRPKSMIFRKIEPRSAMRLVFPLMPFEDSVASGTYEMRVSFIDSEGKDRHQAITAPIVVRSATKEEAELSDVVGATGKFGVTGDSESISIGPTGLPDVLRGAIGFETALKRIAHSEVSLENLDVNLTSVEAGLEFFEPELEALRYELLLARKDSEGARVVRERSVKKHPGVEWLFREIEEGAGPIGRVREVWRALGGGRKKE